MDQVALGKRIKTARERAGMTQEDLAAAVDYSVDHMSVVERGVKAPKLDKLVTIANVLKVGTDELLQDRAGFDRSSLNKPCKICPFCQPALFGLTAQQLILLCCQYDVQMVFFLVLIHIFLLPAAYSRKFFRQQAA